VAVRLGSKCRREQRGEEQGSKCRREQCSEQDPSVESGSRTCYTRCALCRPLRPDPTHTAGGATVGRRWKPGWPCVPSSCVPCANTKKKIKGQMQCRHRKHARERGVEREKEGAKGELSHHPLDRCCSCPLVSSLPRAISEMKQPRGEKRGNSPQRISALPTYLKQ
jgi:hypothetical protein